MATANVHIGDVAKHLSIDVKLIGMRRFRFRMCVVLLLFRIASWISPVQIMINPED